MKPKPKKIRISVFLNRKEKKGLQQLAERDGATVAESIRRAIDAYLRRKGISVLDEDLQDAPK